MKPKPSNKQTWEKSFDELLNRWGFVPTPLKGAKENNKAMRKSLKSFISAQIDNAVREEREKMMEEMKKEIIKYSRDKRSSHDQRAEDSGWNACISYLSSKLSKGKV